MDQLRESALPVESAEPRLVDQLVESALPVVSAEPTVSVVPQLSEVVSELDPPWLSEWLVPEEVPCDVPVLVESALPVELALPVDVPVEVALPVETLWLVESALPVEVLAALPVVCAELALLVSVVPVEPPTEAPRPGMPTLAEAFIASLEAVELPLLVVLELLSVLEAPALAVCALPSVVVLDSLALVLVPDELVAPLESVCPELWDEP